MKHLIIKDRNLRKKLQKNDKKIFLSKFLKKSNKNYSRIKINNRCVITGREHSLVRFFKHSRIVFRTKALEGSYPGVCKSSW